MTALQPNRIDRQHVHSLRLRSSSTCWLLIIMLLAGFFSLGNTCAQEDRRGLDQESVDRWRAKYAEFAGQLKLFAEDVSQERLETVEKPIFTFIYPEHFRKPHGDFFVWTYQKRPYVIGCIWTQLESSGNVRTLIAELHSLAPGPLSGMRDGNQFWNVGSAGLEFKNVPGSPEPVGNSALLSSQMRRIAEKFNGTSLRSPSKPLTVHPKALYSYESREEGVALGGVFGLFDGRDAEIFVIIELQETQSQRVWRFAPVRFSEAALELNYDKLQVWNAAPSGYSDPSMPFFAPRMGAFDADLSDN